MKPLAAIALSGVLLSTAAWSAENRLPGFPSQLLSGDAATGTEHELPQVPVAAIKAGAMPVLLEQTTLDDVKAQFGGTLLHAGDGGESVYWLCYAVTDASQPAEIWFVSDGEIGGSDHAITMVASDYAVAPKTGCPAPSGDLTDVNFGVPGLGHSKADLQSAFGAVNAQAGLVAYTNQSQTTEDGFTTFQALNYLLKDDKVTGFAVSQITSN